MSRLVMKDGKIVMEDDNSQKNAAQKSNSQGSLSMKDGKIVMAQETPMVNTQKNAQYLARTMAAQNAYLEQDRIPTRPTRDNVMDMAINSLRNRVANSTIGRAANEWASRVSGNIQNVLNESPEIRAAKRQARAENEARRQQFAIDTANLIDQASSQYEGPTRTETVRGKYTDTEGADMFSNDWEPGEEKEIEYTRTVRNENYNPLSREDRDALISRYADAMNGNTDANGYQQILYDVTKNGGIDQLYKEQQADAANDREYGRQLRGVNLDDMSFFDRLWGTASRSVSGAGKQIASSGVGVLASQMNTAAMGLADDDYLTSYKTGLNQLAQTWYYGIVNGKDDSSIEERVRKAAAFYGGDAYADAVVNRIRERAEQDISTGRDFSRNLLDDIQPEEGKIWENTQNIISDAGIYDAINSLQEGSQRDIQYAKDVNLLQNRFGDNLVEAGVSTIQNAADAAMAATLGLSGTGVIAMIPFALRAYGGSYAEQLQQATELGGMIGQDVAKKAAQSAGLSSAIEVGTEMMWGMVGAMSKVTGGGALDDAAQQRLTEILSGWAKTETGRKILTTVGEKALGGITEGLEEVIGDAAEQILKNAGIMPGEGEEFSEWMKNAGHSFVTGALGGLLGEVTSVVSSPLQKSQIGKQLKAGGLDISLNELADLANSEGMENTSLAKVYNDTFSGMPRNIESISDLEAGKLYEAYEEMLGKRSEAIDRIEQMQAKVEAGETLTRADVNRITNNSDAVSILAESGAVNEDAFSGGINERRDAVEMALRAFANDSTALSETDAENVQAGTENANTAVSAPNPFMTMSNSAIDNIVQNAQPVSPAQSIRESNYGNVLAGNMLRSAARVVDAAERLNVSERGQDVMARMYSPSMDVIDYVGQMTKYYNQGKEGKTFDVGSIEGVSAIQAQAAFNAGRQEFIERSNNGEEGLRVRTSSEWQNGQSASGSVGVLEESTGAAQGRQAGSFQREGGNARVSAESLRTEGAKAIERSGLRIVTNDSSVAAAKKYAEDRGVNFVAYAGGALNIDGVQSRGYYDSDTNTVYVRADHRLFTAEQIAKHETTHAQIHNGKITLGEVNRETVDFATVRDALVNELGQERFDEMVDAYVEMYAGTNLSRQDVFEELICDSVAGMNDFVSVGHLENAVKYAPSMSKAKAIAEAQEANGTRAGPTDNSSLGRRSIDLTADALGVDAYRDEAGKVHFRVDGREVKKITAEHVKNNSAIGVLIKAGETSKFITAAEAEEQYKAAADLMNMIMSTQDPEMIWAFSGATMFSALKKNSDGQYGTTIDFTTVCRKTQEMVTAMSNAMREAGRGLTKKEVTDLQHDVLESGAEVPCPVCYVFSRWAGIGGMLDDIVRLQDKYAKFTKEQITARTNELKKEIIARGLGSKDKKGRPTVTGSGATALMKELEAEANDAKAKIEWYEDGKKGAVTEAEYKRLKKELPAMQENIGILSEWTWSSQIVTRADYKAVPKDILFDLDAGAKFASEYPAVWKYRTTRGPSSGKAILPYSSMRTGDIITGAEPSAAVRGLFTDIVTNKSKMRGKMTKKQDEAYQKAVLRTAAQNLIGGQRYQSTSDFRYEYALDYIQSFWELQALGSKLQTYTKVVEYADIIAAVGGDVNLSVMPLRSGVENGKLIFSNQTGMNIGAALEANRKFDNAQLILVGINDEHILAALDDHHGTGGENIGFVIPYHASGASITDFISELVKNLGERFVNSNYRDYSAVQNDKEKADRTAEQIMRAEIRKKLLTGKTGVRWNKANGSYESNVKRNELTKEELDLIKGKSVDISDRTFEDLRNVELKALAGDKAAIREYLSWSAGVLNDLYEKMYNGAEKDTVLNSSQAEHIMPHEYWNTNTTRANAYVNGFIFRSYCYSMGLMPRFSWTVGSGENAHGDLSGSDGYWKTLIDRPMYNNDGTYRAQQRINVTDFNNAMLKPSYAEKTYPKYKIQEPNRSRAEKVGTEFGKKISGKLSRDIDTSAFTEAQLSNYNYNQKQTETGSTLKTLGGSAIKRSKYGVGKDIGGRIYMHRDYADSVIPEDVYESAKQALAEAYPDFDYNCVEWSEKDGIVRFDEAPGFDTEREPIVGDYVTVNPDGTTKKGHTDYIWHHKWLWVKDDYKGFDVRDAWEWSKDWLSTISGKTYEVNGKEYNDRGKSDGNGIGRWNAQLDAYGLPRDSAGKFSMDLDEDAAPVRQDHTSRGTSINTTKLPVLYKLADAKGGFKSGTVNIDIGAGVEGTPATAYLAERGVNSLPFDPFNRNRETNMAVMDFLKSGKKADTATCSNVLNVIDNEQARANVILQMAKAIKPDGTAYFTVYSDEKRLEAGKAGEVSSKPDQWQELRAAKTYVPEIKKYFDDVPDPKSGLIIARKPKANLPKATWQIASTEYTDKEGNKPYSKNEAVRFSRDLDADYMAAAESGDTETAAKLVKQAAEATGYTVEGYHGTLQFGFTKIDRKKSDYNGPFFVTADINTARTYSTKDEVTNINRSVSVDEMEAEVEEKNKIAYNEAISFGTVLSEMAGIQGWADIGYIQESLNDIVEKYAQSGNEESFKEEMWTLFDNETWALFDAIHGHSSNGDDMYYRDDVDDYDEWIESDETKRLREALDEINDAYADWFYALRRYYDDSYAGNYHVYINPSNLFVLDCKGRQWNSLEGDGKILKETNYGRYWNTRSVGEWAEEHGYDGVLFHDVVDDGGRGTVRVKKPADVYALFNPQAQVKSADPITYDDAGNIIPLEERFNSKNDDIRFSRELKSEATREAGEKLTERQFYSLYSAHKLDMRNQGDVEEQIQKIRSEGFKGTGGFTGNTMPTNLSYKVENGERKPANVSVDRYAPRKGDRIMFVPRSGINSATDSVKLGYRPMFDYEIVTADYDYQPYYEMYSKAYDAANVKFSRDLSNTELYDANRQLQKDVTELRQQLKTKTEQYKYWKGQTKVTEGRQLRIEDVTKLAREIIKGQESSADAKAVAEKMKALGEYLLNSQDENVYDEARLKAYEIAHDILANAKTLSTKGGDDFYSDFRTALKNQPIYVAPSVREEVAPDGWNDFRKAQYGTVNMTADQSKGKTVDTVYHDLQSTFGEWLLPEYITSEADQLNKILEVIETYRPVYENLNSYEMADAVEWTANEILTRIIGEEIRETNPTYADRMEKKLADQKAKAQTALKQVRQQRDRKVADLKAHYQQVAEDRRNRKIDSEMRSRLLKIAKRLNNKKLDRVTRGLLDQYIGELDLVSKGILGRTVKELETLQAWYDSYKESMGDDFIPDKFIERKIARLSKKHISDLTQEEVADLTTVLLNIENTIRTQNQLIESQIKMDAYAAGVQTIDDINNSNGKTGFLNKFISTETATPEREIHRITGYRENSPLYKAAKELSDGQRKMLDYQMRAEALFKKWTTDKKFIRRIAGKNAEEITVSGYVNGQLTDVKITPAMRMALYLHEKNDDNMRHITKGGVKIPDMALYKKGKLQEAYDKATRVVFTRGMLKQIASKMSGDEKAFADAVDRYYNGMSRNEINDTSEALRGYAIAGVEHYYPIDTDGSFLKKEFDAIKRDGSIEGMGILKERIEGATNPIMLYDMNDTLNRSISQHSKYTGLAIPVRNFNKLYGVTTHNYETSVAETLKKNWGSAATSYIEKMMADVQNGTGLKSDAWGDLLARARSHYAKAVLNTNASVAMKQAASYPTAAAVVGYGPLMKALADTKKIDLEKLAQYTPLLWYRSKGFSTTELGDIGKEGSHIPKVLNWIQKMDIATTTKLAKAAMYYVNENNNLTRGTDAWWRAVAEVYNRIIEETQPNYTMMQRPQILRSDNALTRALNMFKTQPFQNFNILYDAFGNLAAKSREYKANATEENLQALKSARTNVARAVSSQAVSAFIFALMQFAWDAFRGKTKKYKDDDDEMTLASWLKGMGINVLSSVGGMIPFGSYALELGETMTDAILKAFKLDPFFDQTFYGLSENAAESVNDMGNAMINMVTKTAQALSGSEVTESTVRSVVDSMGDIAQFAGIPINNVIKLAQAIGRNYYLATEGKYVGGYHALRLTTDPARYSSDYYDLLWKAYNNDKAAYDEVLQLMLDDGFEEDKIKSAMEKRMKDAQGVSSVKDLESRWMAPSQQKTYDEGLADLEKTTMFQSATDEQQKALLTKLYNLALDNDAGKKLNEKIAGGADVGLEQSEYLLYTLALSMVDEPTESGKYGSYTNDEVEAAILMVPGLSKEERAYLWDAAGKAAKSNPWR